MIEFVTEAMVLCKEYVGEHDARISLYTKERGGVVARATSIRKITSKLAAHLEPLNMVTVRLAQRNGNEGGQYQVADALVADRCKPWRDDKTKLHEAMELLGVIKKIGMPEEGDKVLWGAIVEIFTATPQRSFNENINKLISLAGFDPQNATCAECETDEALFFSFEELTFYCDTCITHVNPSMIYRV